MGVDNSGVASSGEFGTPNAASGTVSKSGSGAVGAASGGKLVASSAASDGKLAAFGVLSFLDSTDGKGKRKPVMQTSAACVLATIGFACLTVWGPISCSRLLFRFCPSSRWKSPSCALSSRAW